MAIEIPTVCTKCSCNVSMFLLSEDRRHCFATFPTRSASCGSATARCLYLSPNICIRNKSTLAFAKRSQPCYAVPVPVRPLLGPKGLGSIRLSSPATSTILWTMDPKIQSKGPSSTAGFHPPCCSSSSLIRRIRRDQRAT